MVGCRHHFGSRSTVRRDGALDSVDTDYITYLYRQFTGTFPFLAGFNILIMGSVTLFYSMRQVLVDCG